MSPQQRQDALVTLAALAALLLWDASGADLWLQRLHGDRTGFAWREHWLTARVAHDGGRWLAGAALVALVFNLWRPWSEGVGRGRRWAWLGVTVACMSLMPVLKKASLTSCPWDLAEFGGTAQHVSHWAFGVADGGAGHCFPSGHATSAAAFFGGWFVLREHQPRLARAWLAAACVLTLFYGWAQLARGAHFASHTLWSAWLCWTLAWLVLGLMPGRATAGPAPAR